MLEIEITQVDIIEGGVEVFARAWQDGQQIGFGTDGSVDIERFRIFNPPVLVPDKDGKIIRVTPANPETEDEEVVSSFREDPEEAILQSVEHIILVKKQKVIGSKNIQTNKVGNTTSTLYPSAGAVAPMDGRVIYDNVNSPGQSWTTVNGQSTGTSNSTTNTNEQLATLASTSSNLTRFYRWMMYGFDTSVIGSDNIDSAILSLYVTSTTTDLDSCDMDITSASPASESSVANGDYDQRGTTRFATGKDIAGLTTSAYADYTLNASGEGHIDKAGNTFFAVQLEWAVDDSFGGTWVSNKRTGVNINMADISGTSTDPKLVVEHSAGGGGQNSNFLAYM